MQMRSPGQRCPRGAGDTARVSVTMVKGVKHAGFGGTGGDTHLPQLAHIKERCLKR